MFADYCYSMPQRIYQQKWDRISESSGYWQQGSFSGCFEDILHTM